MMTRRLFAIVLLAAGLAGGEARASIIETSTTVIPQDHYTAPTSVMGVVTPGQTNTVPGQYVSPFSDATSPYVSVQSGTAEYYFPGLYNTLSLVWGSPDPYNIVYLYNGGNQVGSISGNMIGSSSASYFVTLTSSLNFNRVDFFSSQNAFEFSNVAVAAVPIPAGLSLFAAGLCALGLFGFVRRKATAAPQHGGADLSGMA